MLRDLPRDLENPGAENYGRIPSRTRNDPAYSFDGDEPQLNLATFRPKRAQARSGCKQFDPYYRDIIGRLAAYETTIPETSLMKGRYRKDALRAMRCFQRMYPRLCRLILKGGSWYLVRINPEVSA